MREKRYSKGNEYKLEKNPLVSIIIPIYNAEKTLKRCLSKLNVQTYTNLEIICVDDGSTDSSLAILKKLAQDDCRIKIIEQKNSGPAMARHTALANTNGEYIMFCDSDDWYEPDMVEKMLMAIYAQNVDLVMCNSNVIDLSTEKILSDDNYCKLHLKGFNKITSKNIGNINVLLWNKIFKKDFILKHNVEYPQKYEHDDLIFVYKYLANVKTFYGLDENFYNHVVGNPDSIMGKVCAKTNINSKYDFIFAWQDLYDYLERNSHNKDFKIFFINYCFNHLRYYFISVLTEDDKKQAYIYIQKFINNNSCLLTNKCFNKIKSINNFEEFQEKIYSFGQNLKWYQFIFSIKNSADKIHKIYRILGWKISLKRKKKHVLSKIIQSD